MDKHSDFSAEPCARTLSGAAETRLKASIAGPESGSPVLLAHGFGQTRNAWEATAQTLAEAGYRCTGYDARGHGDSDWNAQHLRYDSTQFIDDLIVVAGEMPEPPVLVAASMGGLFGIAAESRWPGLFRAMVLVDITPRWETAGVERILEFMRAYPLGFESLQAAADAIARYLPHRPRKSEDSLRRLLRHDAHDRWRWHWDPRLIAELIETDPRHQQAALAAAAATLRCPVLLISGGRSDLVSARTIEEFMTLVPQASHVQLAEATHMLAGDDNAAFTDTVLHYLDTLPPASTATPHPSESFTGANQ